MQTDQPNSQINRSVGLANQFNRLFEESANLPIGQRYLVSGQVKISSVQNNEELHVFMKYSGVKKYNIMLLNAVKKNFGY